MPEEMPREKPMDELICWVRQCQHREHHNAEPPTIASEVAPEKECTRKERALTVENRVSWMYVPTALLADRPTD